MRHKLACTLLALALISCQNNATTIYDYQDVKNFHILWDDLLNQNKITYTVYIYSIYCKHCNEVKQDVLTFRMNNSYPLYFCIYQENIPILEDVTSTINASSLDKIGILGTPSLITITNKEVFENGGGTFYVKDFLLKFSS